MAYFTNSATSGVETGAGSFFRTLVTRYNAWRNYRATARALHALSDAELWDIGLGRGDIDRIARASR